jgi:hypothetical protein
VCSKPSCLCINDLLLKKKKTTHTKGHKMSDLYIEKQVGSLCGLHALNHIFQYTSTRFCSSFCNYMGERPVLDLMQYIDVDDAVRHINSGLISIGQPPEKCGSNYTCDTLMKAIQMAGSTYQYEIIKINTIARCKLESCIGILVHLKRGHWTAIVHIPNGDWYAIDSQHKKAYPLEHWMSRNITNISFVLYISKPVT